MDELDPELKHLLKWVSDSSPSTAGKVPSVLYEDVVVSQKPAKARTLVERVRSAMIGLPWFRKRGLHGRPAQCCRK